MLGSTPFHDAAPPEMDTEGELPGVPFQSAVPTT